MAQKEEEAVVTCLHNVVCSPFLPTSNVSLRCCLCPPLRPSSHFGRSFGTFLLMKKIQSLRLRPLLYPGAKETQSCLVDISSVVSSTLVRFVFETVFLPNGLCTLFGHVSAWCANAGIAVMSNLSVFLVLIQRGQFFSPVGMEVLSSAFGYCVGGQFFSTVGVEGLFSAFDKCAFNLGHQWIQSYYRPFAASMQFTNAAQKRCNTAMRSSHITIKNYAIVCNLFRICTAKDGYNIAREKLYAIEQLCVSTLLTNCYVCLNSNIAGSDNTFRLSPPRLSEYIRL